ncbi:MAG: PAS domain S-box protein, partial [Desulfuromonadaceae bacterium]|nr:PAS domain S-box protein [Desulfuromonadaceae bacterium]
FLFMRRYLNRMTSPIITLTRHVEELPAKNGAERIFQIQGADEIATLGDAFNRLVHESDLQRSRLEENLDKLGRSDAQLQRQNGYLQALHETTLGLISRLDVADLLKTIVIRAGGLLGTEHCYVYLKNAAGTEMEMMFQSGIYNNLHHYTIRPDEGIAGRIWSTGKLCNIDDYSRWEGRLADPDRDVLHGMAGVPLKSGEDIAGVLGVAFVDEGILLNDEQLAVLVQFGELASLALENARLIDESHQELAERIKAEEHLRKLSVAVEQSPASIVITDTHGTIEYVNPHFTALTGYSLDEVVGKNPNVLKTGETGREEYNQLWETILAGGEWRCEFHNRKKNGDLYWEQALIAPIRDSNGTITHFIAIKEDVTKRKQLEVQLRHSQKMDAIGQLAGGIAHDFNNILAAIVGYAGIMRLKLPYDSPLKRNAEQIAAAAERGAALTKALLAFSREQVSHPAVVNLNEVINRVHQLLQRLISENVHIEINLEQKGVPVLVDSGEIEQVLMNLLTNARDALPSGGTVVIRTEVATIDSDFIIAKGFGISGNYALVTFSDNGEGMSAEVVRHVFEPFYSTRELGKGTGLGLSIVYGIIKKHHGYIMCHSTPGQGTIFQIYLPLMDPVDAVSREKVQQKVVEARTGDYILLAEDNEPLRLLGRRILEEFGYSVIEAVDGEDALEKFRQQRGRLTLVILDVIMPKMNGRDVYDVMQSIDPQTRILFCSGCAEDVVVSRGELDEGMPFLSKPFTPKELLMKVREVLDNGQ